MPTLHSVYRTITSSISEEEEDLSFSVSSQFKDTKLAPYKIPNEHSQPTWEGAKGNMCSEHPAEQRIVFCFTCDRLICLECTTGNHYKHEHIPASEASDIKTSELKNRLGNLKADLHILRTMQDRIKQVENEVETKAEEIIDQIYSTFGDCVRALQEREKELIAEVERVRKAKSRDLELQMQKIERDIAAADQTIQFTEQLLERASDQEIIQSHNAILSNIEELDGMNHTIPTTQDIMFIPEDMDVFVEATSQLGRIEGHRKSYPLMSRFQEKLPTTVVCGEEEVWSFVVGDAAGSCVARGGDLVSISVMNLNTGNYYDVEVADNKDGTYGVKFTPLHSGELKVVVSINGEHILGSPFSAMCKVERDYTLVGDCLKLTGSKGSSREELLHPTATALNKAETRLYISDTANNRIQVRRYPDMKTLACFGASGSQPGQFSHPYGLCVSGGRVYVADCKNNRVQVLKEDGSPVKVIGKRGSRVGQLLHPYDVKVDASGRVFVSDSGNFRVQVFSEQGDFLTSIGNKGSRDGQFSCPLGLHVTLTDVIVTDFKNNNIQIFSKEGQFRRRIESTKDQPMSNPAGVASDLGGNLFLCNRGNNSVQIFDNEGRVISKFGKKGSHPGSLKFPTSIIVDSKGNVIVCDSLNHRIQIF